MGTLETELTRRVISGISLTVENAFTSVLLEFEVSKLVMPPQLGLNIMMEFSPSSSVGVLLPSVSTWYQSLANN